MENIRVAEPSWSVFTVARVFQMLALGIGFGAGAGIALVLTANAGGLAGPDTETRLAVFSMPIMSVLVGGGMIFALSGTSQFWLRSLWIRSLERGDAVPPANYFRHAEPLRKLVPWLCLFVVLGAVVLGLIGLEQLSTSAGAGIAIVALAVLLAIGAVVVWLVVLSTEARWYSVVQQLHMESQRRLAIVARVDGMRRRSLDPGPGPRSAAWRLFHVMARVLGALLLIIVVLCFVMLVAPSWQSQDAQSAAGTIAAVAVQVLMLAALAAFAVAMVIALCSLVVAERDAVDWSRTVRWQVDPRSVYDPLMQIRAGQYGAVVLSFFGTVAAQGWLSFVGQGQWFHPGSIALAVVAALFLSAALLWGILDIPRSSAERTAIRAAAAPGF